MSAQCEHNPDPCWTCQLEKQNRELQEGLASARELAAMYLQCLNSRALESGEAVELVASFCKLEFEENPWLEAEVKKLVEIEDSARALCQEARLR